MTLRAVDPIRITGSFHAKVVPSDQCMRPGCAKPASDSHHIHRENRHEALLIDGDLASNIASLCRSCHDELTQGVHLIRWLDCWTWVSRDRHQNVVGMARLDPYPALFVGEAELARKVRRKPDPFTPGEPRRRSKWVVKVPDDAENGAEILDALCADVAEQLGYEYSPGTRYPILAYALYQAVTVRAVA